MLSSKGAPALVLLAALASAPVLRATETWLTAILPAAPPSAPVPTPALAKKGRTPPKGKAAPPAVAAPAGPAIVTGESGIVELTAGEFPSAQTPVRPDRIDRTYLRFGTARPMPLTGAREDGTSTKLDATYAGAGLATLGVSLAPQAGQMDGPAFEAYLRSIGAADAAADRLKKKETKKAGKEVALRTAKTFAAAWDPRGLVKPADEGRNAADPLGMSMEFTVDGNPLDLHAGGTLRATLLLEGKPLGNQAVRVLADNRGPAEELRTSPEGRLEVPLARSGRILLAAAAIRRLQKADRKKGEAYRSADWESFSTSLSVGVLAKAPEPSPTPTPAKKKAPPRKKS